MMRILVCGLPHSGNRMISQHLRRAGARVVVSHMYNDAVPAGEPFDHFIEPYRRDEEMQKLSLYTQCVGWNDAMLERCKRHIAKRRPIRICLEDIIESYGKRLEELLFALGLDPQTPWPSKNPAFPNPDTRLMTPEEYALRSQEIRQRAQERGLLPATR